MHFSINKKQFVDGLSSVLQIVPAKSTLPILSNIKIVTGEGKVHISATDLAMGIQTTAKAEIIEDGEITVPAKRLSEIIRELPKDSPINFLVKDYHIKIECSRGVFQLIGIDVKEFPSFPDVENAREIGLKTEHFFQMISNTVYAVSIDEMRPTLNGVYWKLTPEKMIMVATDGHRLAKVVHEYAEDEIITESEETMGVIVPPKALSQVNRLMSSFDSIEVSVSDNFIVFKAGDMVIFSRLIEGDYVNYDQVIPTTNDQILRVDRLALLSAVKRVSILANMLTHQINFFVRPDLIQMSVNTPDLGEADEDIEVEYMGEDMDIGYNAQYMIDILNHITTKMVKFNLGSSTAACIIVPDVVADTDEFTNLIMPIKISD